MNTSTVISTIELNQFISITLSDETSHYYGGYYHVKVFAYCDVPLVDIFFDSGAEFMDAKKRMGESVRFERMLEKMAVAENETASVRNQLIDAFNGTTLLYLSTADFARRFVRSSYLKSMKKSPSQRLSGV